MSHWTEVKTQIRDLSAVREACRELGKVLEVAQPGKKVIARGYYENTIECDAVIKLAGPYDAALIRGPDGTYTIQADYWNGHVAKELGENCNRLTQLYGVHKTLAWARQKGYQARRVVTKTGKINVVLSAI